jgi:hypothetical protein
MAFYVGRRARFSFRRGALLPPADGARQIRRYFESRGISSVGSGRPEPDRVVLVCESKFDAKQGCLRNWAELKGCFQARTKMSGPTHETTVTRWEPLCLL